MIASLCKSRIKARWLIVKREIKFRAWDKFRKKMVNKFILAPTSPGWGAFNYHSNEELNKHISDWYRPLNFKFGDYSVFDWSDFYGLVEYEIMQYTGLKATNGDIYEGDIVQIYRIFHDTMETKKKEKWFVRPVEINVLGVNFGKLTYRSLVQNCDDIDFKIIGNIYENPELLNHKPDRV
jgi:uncharacterized phage protein (TIGR01671 family)